MNNHEPRNGSQWDRKIKCKSLSNKAIKLKQKMLDIISGDLQFESQDPKTKQDYYRAIDHLIAFIDNIN